MCVSVPAVSMKTQGMLSDVPKHSQDCQVPDRTAQESKYPLPRQVLKGGVTWPPALHQACLPPTISIIIAPTPSPPAWQEPPTLLFPVLTLGPKWDQNALSLQCCAGIPCEPCLQILPVSSANGKLAGRWRPAPPAARTLHPNLRDSGALHPVLP